MLRAPQREKNRRAKSQERQTEPKALALAREIAQMVERHLLSGGDFAPAGEVLPKPFLHVIRHLHSSPARVVLLRSELSHLRQAALDGFIFVAVAFALVGVEKSEAHRRRRGFEPIEPVMVHVGKEEKRKSGRPRQGAALESGPLSSVISRRAPPPREPRRGRRSSQQPRRWADPKRRRRSTRRRSAR